MVAYATLVAEDNHLPASLFVRTFECEIPKRSDGSWDVTGQSNEYLHGVREDSWGGWQIHLPDHPDISKQEAQDFEWATNWAAEEWVAGRAHEWTCYRLITH